MDAHASTDPDFELLQKRYREPRRLRTRTMGSPFWVESRDGDLLVTPGSGVGRLVRSAEIQASWPHIARGSPRRTWKNLSNNSSYLESIFDDVQEARVPRGSPVPSRATPDANVVGRLERCILEYVNLRDRHVHEVQELRDQLQARTTEVIGLRIELDAARELLEAEQKAQPNGEMRELLAGADDDRAARRRLEHELDVLRSGQAAEVDRLNALVAESRTQLGRAVRAREAAEESSVDLAQRLSAAESRLKARKRRKTTDKLGTDDSSPGASGVNQLTLALGFTEQIPDAGQRESMEAASRRLETDPDAAVLECRRVLERCARTMWEDAYGDRPPPGRFSEQMYDIRDTAVVPDADWHLMKTLYSRSSDIVHNGGATTKAALWIWLGTAQVAELAGAARPG